VGGRLREPVEEFRHQVVPARRCGELESGLGVPDAFVARAAADGVTGRRDEHLQCVVRLDLGPSPTDG
jgi:hypothetical protein